MKINVGTFENELKTFENRIYKKVGDNTFVNSINVTLKDPANSVEEINNAIAAAESSTISITIEQTVSNYTGYTLQYVREYCNENSGEAHISIEFTK